MKIIISPAKQMQIDTDACDCRTPRFLEQTKIILQTLREKSFSELQALWGCNDKIAEQNFCACAKWI